MAVDPYHGYTYEAEGANIYIYDDFKLKKKHFYRHVYTKIF